MDGRLKILFRRPLKNKFLKLIKIGALNLELIIIKRTPSRLRILLNPFICSEQMPLEQMPC
jgi:hypothetical protein